MPCSKKKSLYWNDDKEIVDTFVLKTIKRFDPANKAKQELLPEYKDEEDKDFARKLFRSTILNADQYQRYMSENSRNWDFLAVGLHGCGYHADCYCRDADIPQHPSKRYYQRIC